MCAISASEYDIEFSGLNELIAADSLNPLYSLSYSANCRPGQLHLNHLLARDPFDKLRAGSQIPAMCGLIGPQDGDLALHVV